MVHNHPGSNRERVQIETINDSRPGLYSKKYSIYAIVKNMGPEMYNVLLTNLLEETSHNTRSRK